MWVFRRAHVCSSWDYTFGPIPATPLSWTRALQTGGFASLPCGRFALIENLFDAILTGRGNSARRGCSKPVKTVTRSEAGWAMQAAIDCTSLGNCAPRYGSTEQ
jgi:hypothetical protein